MRLARKNIRSVTIRERIGGEDVPVWGEGTAIEVSLQPASASSAARMQAAVYGKRLERMLLLLYTGSLELKAGMCVSVDAPYPGHGDYEIASVSLWPRHTEALIEWLEPIE